MTPGACAARPELLGRARSTKGGVVQWRTKPRRDAARILTIIGAQALAEGIPIASSARIFAAYEVQVVW
jgi:hypothetical protein